MKIDVNAIPGYAEMSAEDKLKALEEFEFEAPERDDSEEVKRLKTALSNANSQAAEWKRQFREKQSEAERAEAERREQEEARETELKTLRREKTVSGHLASCLSLGYPQDLAQRAAEAFADGNAAEIMACQQEFLEAKQREYETTSLNRQPGLSVGAPPTAKEAERDAINKRRSYFGLPPIK